MLPTETVYLRAACKLPCVPARGLLDNGGVIQSKECDGRHDVSLHADHCAPARNAAFTRINPDSARTIIDLIDAMTESAYGLCDPAGHEDFLIHEPARICVDFTDSLSLTACESQA